MLALSKGGEMKAEEKCILPGCDKKAAGSMAVSSVASYFKDKGWKIVSFFPNTLCPSAKECTSFGVPPCQHARKANKKSAQ